MGSMLNLCHDLKSQYPLLSYESVTKKDGSDYILIRSSLPDISRYLPHLNAVVESGVVKLLSYHGRILKEENFAGGIILEQLNEGKLFFCIGVGSIREGLGDSALRNAFSEPSTNGEIVYRSRSCPFVLEGSPGICSSCQMFLESLNKVQEDIGEETTAKQKYWDSLNHKEENYFEDEDVSEENDDQNRLHTSVKVENIDFEEEDASDDKDNDWEETTKRLSDEEKECPKCGKVCKKGPPFNHHFKTCGKIRTDLQKSPIACEICFQKFNFKHLYTRHFKHHKFGINLEESIDCPICKKCLDNRKCLNDHIHESHDPSKSCCVICFEMMPNENLKKHMDKSHGDSLKKHLCTKCGKRFKYLNEVIYHNATYHDYGGEKYEICDQCGKGFPHDRALDRHVRRVHDKSTVYPCDQCDKVFYEKYRLKKHVDTHSGDKPFKCAVCSYCTLRKSNVFVHLQRVHKKEPSDSDVIFIPSGSCKE